MAHYSIGTGPRNSSSLEDYAPSQELSVGSHTLHAVAGAREEVAASRITERFIDTCRKAARVVTRSRKSPTGSDSWLDQDIDELINDTIERVTTPKVVLAACEAATDAEFFSWLKQALRTTLNQRARRTPLGRVIRATDDALREDPDQFTPKNGYWHLRTDDRQPVRPQQRAALVAAAWEVHTATVRLSPSAMKTPPMAARRDVRAVCAAVLGLAGPLEKAHLAGVLAERFGVVFEERLGYDDFDDRSTSTWAATSSRDAFDLSDDRWAALWIYEQLTEYERRVLRLRLDHPSIRNLADALGCTKYRAEQIQNHLNGKLRHFADQLAGDAEGAMEQLLELVRHRCELRHST